MQTALDFGRSSTPRPRAARARTPLIGGRTPVARQASAEGAALNAPNRDHQCGQLLRYIERQGMRGATDAEIGRDLKWPVNVITARRNDLYADGQVVQRWPEPRRRSVTTNVPVIVTVAASVVRAALPATFASDAVCSRPALGAAKSDGEPEPRASTGGGPCVTADHHGNDAEPARADGPREVVTLPVGEKPESTPRPRMTLADIEAAKTNTRVRLRDGVFGQLRAVVAGLVCIYVFEARAFITLDPHELCDWRDVDGELRQTSRA